MEALKLLFTSGGGVLSLGVILFMVVMGCKAVARRGHGCGLSALLRRQVGELSCLRTGTMRAANTTNDSQARTPPSIATDRQWKVIPAASSTTPRCTSAC